ncbi:MULTISPECIES: phosphohistidine phosphatase SixA [Salinivibrio]|uniref:Phosphohistidine phosphatase SixA n=1 Tax=Salinivibrio costicola TaxID=51367 RepID=A0ABX6K568_SALCS|nr:MULTISPECIES: phosphohistidine phosphatase SixA [Salinivibrio]ODQ01129.1 phosphohistidine phosphatase SixA [Salinivibrio sp. DV]OOF12224.1 phosphohistidine phosphatase SixA [Salinivibrio sp. PR5]OOF15726.1 phosphohistidine phosphatase SixA [Salinivibrio sp. PR919]OOF19531.1 phosphohistidine phosphatase SixA [Salinivibrio sp. PR932]OOF30453.1 phosphohistidine phosphatase SixA [Salinivibrio proteolyticus]
MKLIIMRHGEAQAFAASDSERGLTANGERQSEQMAAWLSQHLAGETIDKVLVSPYLRAQQTWQVCAPHLPAREVVTEPDITPYGQSDQVYTYLQAMFDVEAPNVVLVVSHLPLVGYLTNEWLQNGQPPMFSTSAMAVLDIDGQNDTAELIAMMSPRELQG